MEEMEESRSQPEILGRDRELGRLRKSWVATRNFLSRPSSVVAGRLVCRNINFVSRHRCSSYAAWAYRDNDFHVAT